MKKARADSVLKSLPEDKQEAIYERVATLSLADGLGMVNAPECESGFGITIGRSAFAAWLAHRRALRFGARLRKGREMVEALAKDAEGAEKYDPVVFAALKEHLLNLIATESVDLDTAKDLGYLILSERRLSLDTAKLKSAEKFGGAKLKLQAKQLDVAERKVKLLEETQADAKAKIAAALKARTTDGVLTEEGLKRIEEAAALL